MTAVAEWGSGPEALPGRVDVCLVNMPYASLNRPSLAPGLLKAILEREGIAVQAVYPNLWFAEEVGLSLYHLSALFPKEFLAGEWTFAAAAFPGSVRDDEESLRRIAAAYEQIAGYDRDEMAGVAAVTAPVSSSGPVRTSFRTAIPARESWIPARRPGIARPVRRSAPSPDPIDLSGGAWGCRGLRRNFPLPCHLCIPPLLAPALHQRGGDSSDQ